jgi:hypothetical protein
MEAGPTEASAQRLSVSISINRTFMASSGQPLRQALQRMPLAQSIQGMERKNCSADLHEVGRRGNVNIALGIDHGRAQDILFQADREQLAPGRIEMREGFS